MRGRWLFVLIGLLLTGLLAAGPALAAPPARGDDGPKSASRSLRARTLHGTITNISGTTWTLATRAHGTVTVDVSGAEVKAPHRIFTDVSAFKVNDQVTVKLDRESTGPTLKARRVHLVPGRVFLRFHGTVTGRSDTSLTVQNARGTSRTFTLPTSTAVREDQAVKALSDIQTGRKVTVWARRAEPGTAVAVILHRDEDD